MRTTALFFVYLFLCLAAAALLAVPLMQTGWVDYPPERVMGRLAQALILLGIWPLLLRLKLANRADLGYGASRPAFLRALALGWVLGVLILLALALALLGLAVRVPDPEPGTWSWIAGKAVQALIGVFSSGSSRRPSSAAPSSPRSAAVTGWPPRSSGARPSTRCSTC